MKFKQLFILFCHFTFLSFASPAAPNRCLNLFKIQEVVTSPEANVSAGKWAPDATRRSLGYTLSFIFQKEIGRENRVIVSYFHRLALEYFRENSVVMEIGASYGEAMSQLVAEKNLTAIAVDIEPRVLRDGVKSQGPGRYIGERGWAEDILLKYVNKIDDLIDVWGAFMYSPARILLVERIYNALREDGRARLACIMPQACLQILKILNKRFPQIFQIEYIPSELIHVLVINKERGRPTLVTGLKDGKTKAFMRGKLRIPLPVILGK